MPGVHRARAGTVPRGPGTSDGGTRSLELNSKNLQWPELRYSDWKATCQTLHLYTQIVGKVRLTLTPWINHSWHTTLYVSVNGLRTDTIAFDDRAFEIEFDFLRHELVMRSTDGRRIARSLEPRSVADFYAMTMEMLAELGVHVKIHTTPNELPDPLPLDQDTLHASYDADPVQRFWRILVQSNRVFRQFRTEFIGKVSPVQFFWGSFDLAVTRFSGRPAPLHPGGFPNLPDTVTREAYSHEVSSAGFWPGGGPMDDAAYFSYAYPTPAGFAEAPVEPDTAFFHEELGEFLLPYDAVRTSTDPDDTLLRFLRSTYVAAADGGGWERTSLECEPGRPGIPRRVR